VQELLRLALVLLALHLHSLAPASVFSTWVVAAALLVEMPAFLLPSVVVAVEEEAVVVAPDKQARLV
jgi:hypothetical protein